jgi:transposase
LFKAEAVSACMQEGVSIASVALARGLNANLLRSWVRQAERRNAPIAIQRAAPAVMEETAPSFVSVPLPPNDLEAPIRIEVRRKGRRISIEWPATAAGACAVLLKELLR